MNRNFIEPEVEGTEPEEQGTEPDDRPERAEDEERRATELQNIRESGSIRVRSRNGNILQTLLVAGQIEGHNLLPSNCKTTKYEHIIPQIVTIEEDREIDGLLILLNTVGGDVEAGLAIAEMIAGMRKPTVSLILGGGHSIGIPLAVCAKESFIVKSATMTIHPVRMNGLVIGVPQSFTYFSRMQSRISDFIVANSHVRREELDRLMLATDQLASDMGSLIEGQEAVNYGIIDQVGSISDALDSLHRMCAEYKKSDTD